MSMCRVVSCPVQMGCLLWPMHSLGKTVSLYSASFWTPRPNFLLFQVSLDFLFLHSCPLWWKGHCFLFLLLVLDILLGLHRTIQLQLFVTSGWGKDLEYWNIEWFASETNRDHSVFFKIACKYCILNSFVDYEGYSISSKGFLPTVIDIMLIWFKFAHSSPF